MPQVLNTNHSTTDETVADELITLRDVCAMLNLTPYSLHRRASPVGMRPQLMRVGPHDDYRLAFTRADIEKLVSLQA